MSRAARYHPPMSRSRVPSSLSSLALVTLSLGVTGSSPMLLGCSSEGSEVEAVPADEVVPQATPLPAAPDPLFDAEGRLLPSNRALGGLTLPRGLTNEQQGNNRHLFEAAVPAIKLVQYFGPRLLTSQVEPSGTGASFINAIALRPTGTAYHMDVLVTERGSHQSSVLIRLTDAPTAMPRVPTEEDRREYHERLD